MLDTVLLLAVGGLLLLALVLLFAVLWLASVVARPRPVRLISVGGGRSVVVDEPAAPRAPRKPTQADIDGGLLVNARTGAMAEIPPANRVNGSPVDELLADPTSDHAWRDVQDPHT